MNINFKKAFGIATVLGAVITGAASVGKEITKFKEENPKKDDPVDNGHTPTESEAKELAESCPESGANTEEQMIADVIEESEDEEETD